MHAKKHASGQLSRPSGEHTRRRSMSGEFDVRSAAQAIDLILDASLHGSLMISDGLVDVCFFFTRGGLRVVATKGRKLPTLRSRLLPQNLISKKDANAIERELGRQGQQSDERDLLIEMGGLRPEDCDGAAREIIPEVFLDCLFWENPQYEVTTGEPNIEMMQRPDLSALTLSLGIKDLLGQIKTKIRTISEIRRTVSDMQVIAEPTPKGRDAVQSGARLGEGEHGRKRTRFLKRVVQEPGLGAEALAKRLSVGELEVASRLHELSTDGFLKVTRKARSKKEELERIRKMEEAIDVALNQLLRRMRLATDAAGVGDTEKAARHMARAGGLLLNQGRTDEAVHTFKGALKHSESDLEAREGFVRGLWASKRDAEAAKESEVLGQRYLELNLPGRARKVLERALGYEEQSSTLDLLVKSLVKQRKPKLAAEAGERLVNRLRREGRTEEARDAAAQLMTMGDDKDRKRLMRAAGVDHRKTAALLALGGLISLGFVPVKTEEASRQKYVAIAEQVSAELNNDHDLAQLTQVLGGLSHQVEDLSQGDSAAAAQAAEVHASLNDIRADCEQAAELHRLLPWQSQADLQLVANRLELIQPRSSALREPLLRLKRQLVEYRERANLARDTLKNMPPSAEAYAQAAGMRQAYAGLPNLLREATLQVDLVTDPEGASVEYDGTSYTVQKTPMQIHVPLRGSRLLELELKGYASASRTVDFDTLKGRPRVFVTLRRRKGPIDQPKIDKIPVVTGDPTRPKRPNGTGVVSTTKRPKRPKTGNNVDRKRKAQVELRDGYMRKRERSLIFEQDYTYFGKGRYKIKLPARYRANVKVYSRYERKRCYMDRLEVVLIVWRRSGWKVAKSIWINLDDDLQRPIQTQRNGKRKVLAFERTLRLDRQEVFEDVKDALKKAMSSVRDSERRR